MSLLSTFYPEPVDAAALGLGTSDNVTFASVTANSVTASGGSLNNTTIGSTTPAAGTFTTLTANNGTVTANSPALNLTQVWNASGTRFNTLEINITNTASEGRSAFLQTYLGGVENIQIASSFVGLRQAVGNGQMFSGIFYNGQGVGRLSINARGSNVGYWGETALWISPSIAFAWAPVGSSPTSTGTGTALFQDANNILGQRNGTNAQTFNIYNTYTDSTNYERGFLKWDSNVFRIGTEADGSGTVRNIEITSPVSATATGGFAITAPSASFTLPRDCRISSPSTGVLNFRSASGNNTEFQFNGPIFSGGGSNIEYGFVSWQQVSNVWRIGTAKAGSGVARPMEFVTDNAARIKIGSAGEIGFFGATAAAQPAAIADATDAATTQSRLNDLLAAMRTLGLIAT